MCGLEGSGNTSISCINWLSTSIFNENSSHSTIQVKWKFCVLPFNFQWNQREKHSKRFSAIESDLSGCSTQSNWYASVSRTIVRLSLIAIWKSTSFHRFASHSKFIIGNLCENQLLLLFFFNSQFKLMNVTFRRSIQKIIF